MENYAVKGEESEDSRSDFPHDEDFDGFVNEKRNKLTFCGFLKRLCCCYWCCQKEKDDAEEKERKKKKRKKKQSSDFSGIFYDFLAYMLFIGLFMTILFGPRNSDAYWFKKTMDNFFFENEFDYGVAFNDIGSMGQFWTFMNNTLLPNLFPTVAYSGLPLSRLEQRYMSDTTTYRLGHPRLRIIRMKEDLCLVPEKLNDAEECIPTYRSAAQESREDYTPFRGKAENSTDIFWRYTVTGSPSYRSPNTKITYGGNGYIEDLGAADPPYQVLSEPPSFFPSAIPSLSTVPTSKPTPTGKPTSTPMPTATSSPSILPTVYPTLTPTNNKAPLVPRAQYQLLRIKNYEWIDAHTRAFFIEFNCYQPNTDLVSTITMCVEFTSSGAIMSSFNVISGNLVRPLRVLRGDGVYGSTVVLMILEIVFYCLVFMYISKEFKEWRECHIKREPYLVGWNVVDMLNLSLFIFVILVRAYTVNRTRQIDWLADEFNSEIQYLLWQSRLVDTLNAVNAILVYIKIFKFTEQHPKLGQFTNTLKCASADIGSFLLVLIIMLTGFGMGFNLAFGSDVRSYMDLSFSIQTLFACTLGDFDLDEISASHHILGPILFCTFIVVIFFIILSMLLTIIDGAYDQAVEEAEAKGYSEDLLTRDILIVAAMPGKKFAAFINGAVAVMYKFEGLTRIYDTKKSKEETKEEQEEDREDDKEARHKAYLLKVTQDAEQSFNEEYEQVRAHALKSIRFVFLILHTPSIELRLMRFPFSLPGRSGERNLPESARHHRRHGGSPEKPQDYGRSDGKTIELCRAGACKSSRGPF